MEKKKRYWPSLPEKALDWEFTSIIFGRPIAAFILYPFKSFLSPNIVTIISFILALIGTGLLLTGSNIYLISVLLFLSMILDDGDGLLARYQGKTSYFGSYLDKSVDIIRFFLLFNVLSWIAFKQNGNFFIAVSGSVAACGLLIQGYTKWLTSHMEMKRGVGDLVDKPSEDVPWVGGILKSIFWPFAECDLTLWIIALLIAGRIDILVIILAVSQFTAALISIFQRGFQSTGFDRK
ncbi:CDP-alcohol phosphatidyltransferase family protein [Myxococcota bacterium]|nr:CDP-alcohol phosphatidyltransferase family protein [Myxococcota bacterium]MBU1382353.1 CDP-alcohol phosphatidyltransferase family protein [Myxococcota bacterium]MBU1498690.1 CDP-alcohol phosphatidyltransferase family protein [Myxococcota bacterium]